MRLHHKIRISAIVLMVCAIARTASAAGSDASIRAEWTAKQLVADGRWGAIATIPSIAVAVEHEQPRDLTVDDVALASAFMDDRLGYSRPYPATVGEPAPIVALRYARSVPRGLNPWFDFLVSRLERMTPESDPTACGEAAFRRLPVASHKVGATAAVHLEQIKTKTGRELLRLTLEELFRRAETDRRTADLLAAALGSTADLKRPIAEIKEASRKFDEAAARPLAEAKTPEERRLNWAFRLAEIQAARVRELARSMLPSDLGDRGNEERRRPSPSTLINEMILFTNGLLVIDDGNNNDAADDAKYKQVLKNRHKIEDARFATGLVTGILYQIQDPTVRDVARVLDTTAGVVLQTLFATTVASSVAVPLAILNGVSQLLGLLGGGPSEMQLLREQIAELHREVRIFRRETQINFAYLHADLHSKTDAILERVDRLAALVDARFSEMEGRFDDIERRTIELRGVVEAYHQQTLKRFDELYHTSFLAELNRFLTRERTLTGLTATSPRAFLKEIDDFITNFYTFGAMVAVTKAVAGGDWRIADAYSSNVPGRLVTTDASKLVAFADSPRGVYVYINDYADIAFGPDPSRQAIVNPDAWQLGVTNFFRLASRSPQAVARPETLRRLARMLAELYVRGEMARDFRLDLTRMPNGSGPNRSVFGRLVRNQEMLIAELERILLSPSFANKTSEVIENINVWGTDPFKPLPGKIVCVAPITAQPLLHLANSTGFPLPSLQAPEFQLNEQERLALEATIPDAYRLAVQLRQGNVKFVYEDLRFAEVREAVRVERVSRGLSPFTKQEEFSEIHHREWFGKARLTVAAYYSHGDRENATYPSYRRQLVSPTEVKIGGLKNEEYKNENPRHQPLSWEGEGRLVEKRSEHHGFWFFGRDVDHAIFVDEPAELRAKQVTENWGAIKAAMLDPKGVTDLSPDFSAALWANLTREVVRQLTNIQIKAAAGAQDGLGDLGNALRALYGTQLLIYRYLELAMPETLRDSSELQDLTVGRGAVLNWEDLGEAIRPAVKAGTDGKYRLEIKGLIQGGPDGKPRVPLAARMRQRNDRLRLALDEAVTNAALDPNPPAFPDLDFWLQQFEGRAKHLGIDLNAEVEKLVKEIGVTPRAAWSIRRSSKARELLNGLHPDMKKFEAVPVPTEKQ